jgi:Protein of unknown function (DUF3631)
MPKPPVSRSLTLVASLAREHTDKCIEVLFGIMTNADASHVVRTRAAKILFNRGPLVELLVDIRKAFGEAEAIRSAELVAKLAADPERPWAEWKHGRPLTQKQLGGLLRPFGIVSEIVSIPGFNDAKGYKRIRFEAAWEAYCPGQNPRSIVL